MFKITMTRLYRFCTWLLWSVIIVVAVTVLALRWFVLPNVHNYKDDIARNVSEAVGQNVTIGDIKAGWDGMRPYLDLHGIVVHDAENRPALTLDHIEASLSWLSIPLLEPRLASLTIHEPRLTVRRDEAGAIYVAGIPMSGPSKPQFPNWLLRQSQIDVINASVIWEDDLKKTSPLSLDKLNLQVQSPAWEGLYGRHRFGLTAQPSAGSSQPIDLRGDLIGRDVAQPENWSGTIYARLEGTDIAAWRAWVDLPVGIKQGTGATQAWVDFADGQVEKIAADVVLANVVTALDAQSPEVALKTLSGRLSWQKIENGHEIRAEKLRLLAEGLEMQNGNARYRERMVDDKPTTDGSLRLDEISLEQLAAFARHFSLGGEARATLTAAAPTGLLRKFELDWSAAQLSIQTYGLRTEFSALGMQPYLGIPGFAGLDGKIDASEKGGDISFSGASSQINVKDVLRQPIPFDRLSGRATWSRKQNVLDVAVSNLAISSPHLSGVIEADYRHSGKGAGTLDLTGKFTRFDARYANFYYPTVLSQDTLYWLDNGILGGRIENAQVKVKGDLDNFPWDGDKNGLFEVTANLSDATLHYADGWPNIEGLTTTMLFRGNRMELNANRGKLFGNQLTRVKAVIPNLSADDPMLEVTGEANAPTVEAIRFINASPVLVAIDRFTEGMQAGGNGKLTLGLTVPLNRSLDTRVKGSYLISNGTLVSGGAMPKLENINGRLDFTETGIRAQNATALVYGGPAQINIETGKGGLLRVTARGRVDAKGLRQVVPASVADRLRGGTEWTADIQARKQQVDVLINSSLTGLASTLPAPFAKSETESMPLAIAEKSLTATQEQIALSLGKVLNARLLRVEKNGGMEIERGEIYLGNLTADIPAQPGIAVRGNLDHVDVEEWQHVFADADTGSGVAIRSANLAIQTLDVFGRRINKVALDAAPVSDGWRADINSQEITGDVRWVRNGNGKIVARLKSLLIPDATPSMSASDETEPQKSVTYPAIDLAADSFEIKQKKLGRLELVANQNGGDWNIDKLVISNPDSTLTVNGVWKSWRRRPITRLNLDWKVADIGKTLERFGYPDTVQGGKADLTGNLRWPGSPHEFTAQGLDGKLALDVEKGQFLKIQPGVGRLLGLLSLQSLPRRLSLDFRDLFSSGFAFDKISAHAAIENGVARSDDFEMDGPAAKVAIKGEVDLAKETQHLHIKVTPSISDSISLAAFAGGPIAGVAAFIAQKLLKDPLNKIAAYEYEMTGTWDDPQEVKSATVPTESANPQPSPIPGR
ncbi:MAG: TIGR02099 family protein [Methylobacillus sp.]|jgi:uncharacterized protein (TIGR02099 family)|nr:TIGR02099 family protein [Methylobacillus sp.]